LVTSCPTITVTNPATTTGTVGVAFSQTFTQSGGIGTTTFSESGGLPSGLTFHTATGVLDGTPSQFGTFGITVTATDSHNCQGTGSIYTLVISCPTITVTNPGVNTGTVDTPFSQTFTQSGAFGTATFTTASTLPAGLTLSTAGVLSGTPTAPVVSVPIVVTVTDGAGCTGTGSTYSLTINCQTITVTKPVVTTGTVDAPFSQTFTQSGVGTHTPASFAINSGTLPAGLTLSNAGVLSGTPTQQGSFPITVKVTDVNGCSGVSSTYNLFINCQTITVTNPLTNTGMAGVAFSQTFTQSAAHGTATFTTASTLPTGFSLSNAGVLSGTTTQHGLFSIVVTVTDANGCTGTGSTYSLNIACNPISVTNPVNTNGTVAVAFSETFTSSGTLGTPSYTTASTLPTGLTLHAATGILDGTPTQAGNFPIVVTATDSNGCTGTGATYTLHITCNVITVTPPGVTSGTAGVNFDQAFSQSGGNGTINWTETGDTLPAGIVLDSTTGHLHGSTTSTGSFNITVTATDANGCSGSTPYTLTINCQTVTVTNPAQTSVQAGTTLDVVFTASGILGTVTWSETGDTLPGTIALNASTGHLSGTTNSIGTFNIVVKALDSNGCFGTSNYTLTVTCPTITVTRTGGGSFPAATFNVGYPAGNTFTATGQSGTIHWAFPAGDQPPGINLTIVAGSLSGIPSATGTFNMTPVATDQSTGCTGTATFPFSILPNMTADSYSNLVNNTQAYVTGGSTSAPATPAVQLSGTIVSNDTPASGVTVAASSIGTFATTQGGSVTIAADGTFKYTPPLTSISSDTFNYTGSSNTGTIPSIPQYAASTGPATNTGTVTLNLVNRVWYVKNNAAGGGNGQSQSPFNTLAAAAAASAASDIIFVYNGDGTTANQTAGITLKSNQQLIGEGVALVVNSNTLVAAGTKPQISNTTAASDAVTINDGNTVKGLTITGATRDGISSVVTHAGFTADTITIQNNTSSGLHLTSMTGTVTVTNATISGNATGLDVNNGTAAITLDNTNTITSGAAGRTVSIQNRPVSAGTIALGATINDAGTGILVNNNASGTINFTGSQTPNVGGANTAVNLTTNTGTTINFSGTLNATSATGSGFNATGGGTLSVTGTANVTTGAAGTGVNINAVTVGASGVTFNSVNTTGATTGVSLTSLGNGNVTINGGTISGGTTGLSLNTLGTSTVTLAGVTLTGSTTAISGTTFGTLSIGAAVNVSGATALNLATGAVTGTFANVSSTGGTNGVNLNAVTGTWGATAGSLTGATGATFNVTGGSGGTISWGATINQAGGANAVTIASSNSNTINFSANVTTSGTSTGIGISGSTGTYNFTGAANTITGTGGGITISSEASGTISFGSGTSINGATNTFSVTSSSANITYSGTITDNVNGGTLLNIATYSTGTLTMNGTSLSGNVNGINGVISALSAITGTVVINNLSLTSGNNNFSNTLVAITGVNTGGSITFNHLTLSATGTGHTGKGLTMVGNGTLAITATGGASSIDVSSTALDLNGQALGASALATLNSSGGVNGILLTNVTGGTMTITGGTIAGNTGGAFVVSGGTPSVSYGGTITQNTAGQRAVDLQTRTGGTITFSGLITSSGGNGVFMNNAAGGSTTVFSGGLTLSTGGADAFTATGGGIVNVSGTNNVTTAAGKGINWNTDTSSTGVTFNNVTSTTGAAVTIVSSGGSNFTFNDITSTTGTAVTVTTATGVFSFHKISSNGAAKGITVSALTGTGSFTVTGTGGSGLCDSTHIGATDCQGGTIQGGTTRGAEFNNARAVTLNNMYFKGNGTTAVACGDDVSGSSNTTCDAAIYLVTAASPTLNKIYVDGTGSNDSGIIGNAVSAMTVATLEIANFTNVAKTPFNFQNLTGTTGVTGLNVHNNSGLHNVMITNNTGTANITLTSPTLTSNSGSGNPDQLQVNSYIAGTTLNVTATNVNITASSANTGNGVMFQANSGSSMTSILNGGVVTGTNGLLMQETGTNTTFNFTVTGLTSVTTHNLGSNAITVGKANGTNGVFTGTVTNNVITSATCGGGCAGIKVASFGVSGASTVNVSNNNISGVDAQGIWIVGGQGGSSLTATVQTNNIHNPVGSPNTSYAIDVYPGTTSGDAVCFALNLGDMTATHTVPANRNTITGTWQSGGNPIEAAIFNSSTFKLLNYSGSTDANAAAWIAASNGGLGTDAFHLGTNQFTSGASCP
ncbi:MAG TPA: putative Ig domain-containing protein, partial [Thermoanaerobaculia bacterium]|nr:putative Ig domain-containing protein [Thermoanaerobaculia bacterium]